MLKYDEELYLDCGFYDGDMDVNIENYKSKIVKRRKPHECTACKKEIKAGEQAVYESGFWDGEIYSSYTCLKCIEDWIEKSGQADMEDEGE